MGNKEMKAKVDSIEKKIDELESLSVMILNSIKENKTLDEVKLLNEYLTGDTRNGD